MKAPFRVYPTLAPVIRHLVLVSMACLLIPSAASAAIPAADSCPSGCTKPGGHIHITSASNIQLDQEVTISILLENVSDVYGIELEFAFNPAILQVQDDKPGTVGTQILPGNLPNPELCFVAQNAADNAAGSIAYAVALLSPNPSANGSGTLATIRFKAIGAGTSTVSVASTLAVGSDSCCLEMTVQNGTVTTGPAAGGSVTGKVRLQGRTNYAGVTVSIAGNQTTTAANGTYTINGITPGSYTISARIDNYVRADKAGVQISSGNTTQLPDVTLLAGDIDDNCQIDIFDLVTLGAAYGTSPPAEPDADFNQDNLINIFDLVLLAGNYNQTCPSAW